MKCLCVDEMLVLGGELSIYLALEYVLGKAEPVQEGQAPLEPKEDQIKLNLNRHTGFKKRQGRS